MNMLSDRSVLVLGLGESGLAMAHWCARNGARLRVADTRAVPPGLEALRAVAPSAEVVAGPLSDALLDGIDLVAVSPGIDARIALLAEARRRGVAIVGEMTLFAEALKALGMREKTHILAITGTNGKTTTTTLTAALCNAAAMDAVAAGNISPAALAVLMERRDSGRPLPECWVLELSSFQLESSTGLDADAATVLNVTDDHLDRHGDLPAYAAAKARIFAGGGVQVLNRQDARVMAMRLPGRQAVSFGTDAPTGRDDFGLAAADDGTWLVRGDERLVRMDDLKIAGLHNATNALAALALGTAIGLPRDAMIAGLKAFRGLPHRVEPVAQRADGVVFYDDSKGTNVGATLAALEGLGCPVVLIAGGDGKGQDFTPLREAVARHARAVVLIGRDAALIEAALDGSGIPVERAADMDAAVARAALIAQAGDAVLLSPACASLDMYRNYAHRAEVFVAAVQRVQGVAAA